MFKPGKKLTVPTGIALPFLKRRQDLKPEDVREARVYIAEYWKHLERFHPKDDGSTLGVPKPYLVPSYEEGREFDFNELYYWDSYFMMQGMLDNEHRKLNLGVLEDLLSLFKRFNTIPNASRTYLTGRSQPPLLTSFIFDLYNTYSLDRDWLEAAIDIAKQEYKTVWMGTSKPNARLVYKGLSRYYDINVTDDLAEAESGWDYTPRFNRHCLNYLPVDLNALLYKYEMDFATTAKLLSDKTEVDRWTKVAHTRRSTMHKLMWDSSRGLFYDYNYVKERQGNVSSLASYYPLWAGMVDGRQAVQMVKALKHFMQKGGLSTTDNIPLGQYVFGSMPRQWAYPNGWAPLHFLVVKGLQRYGYHNDARAIAMSWLHTNLDWYNTHGQFLEKYNVAKPGEPPAKGVYPTQVGFGWSNAIFERFCQEFVDGERIGNAPQL
ncbi:MAG TPA: trehalase family glycosidase [Patescibacteria group bacterium]|nr:trehalase family glycosidase [Patescibacteria group bacterium]